MADELQTPDLGYAEPGAVEEYAEEYAECEPGADDGLAEAADADLTPAQVFARYDADGSGAIDMEEFVVMLPYLGILVNEAKAERIFRRFDADGGGDISFDEFQSALYACDTKGNSKFTPHQMLTPMDVFEQFTHRDGKEHLEKPSFTDALKYMGFHSDENRVDMLFDSGDKNYTGMLDYAGFRGIFLDTCNARKELEMRGVYVGKHETPHEMREKFDVTLAEEEKIEEYAMKVADERTAKEKKRQGRLKKLRAEQSHYDDLLAARQARTDWRFREEEFAGSVEVLRKQAAKLWDDAYPPINEADDDGADALHRACYDGKLPLVKWLVQQEMLDFSDCDHEGRASIAYAVQGGQQHVIEWLVTKGASLADVTERAESSLLHLACESGRLPVVMWLISEGLRPYHTDKLGRTSLHYAAGAGHLDIVQCLHARGLDVQTVDEAGQNPMYRAICGGHLKTVQWLSRHHTRYDPEAHTRSCIWEEGDNRDMHATCPVCSRRYAAWAPGQRHLISLRASTCFSCVNKGDLAKHFGGSSLAEAGGGDFDDFKVSKRATTFEVHVGAHKAAGEQMTGTTPDGQVITFAVPPNVAWQGGIVNVPYKPIRSEGPSLASQALTLFGGAAAGKSSDEVKDDGSESKASDAAGILGDNDADAAARVDREHLGTWHIPPHDCAFLPCGVSPGLRGTLKGRSHWSCCLQHDQDVPCTKASERGRRRDHDTCNKSVSCFS